LFRQHLRGNDFVHFNAIYATRIHLHTVWIYCAKPLAVEAEPLHLFHLRALHLPAYMARACKIVSADAGRARPQYAAALQRLPYDHD
jgi:hypothetical protein